MIAISPGRSIRTRFSQSLTISVENCKLGINRISDADCYLWNAISEAVRSM